MGTGRWVSAKAVAGAMNLHENTLWSWARGGLIVARRLAGDGPWRILQAPDGRTVDADSPESPSPLRPRHVPEWVSVNEAARAAGVHPRNLRRWVKKGKVVARIHAKGRGLIEVALDWDGLPGDTLDAGTAARLSAAATATAVEREAARRRLHEREGAAA
ncbi:MerR family transcriptional regulator [Archangium gephyra]|nr:MerR family transcriptional regulator [Archangium gephyra]